MSKFELGIVTFTICCHLELGTVNLRSNVLLSANNISDCVSLCTIVMTSVPVSITAEAASGYADGAHRLFRFYISHLNQSFECCGFNFNTHIKLIAHNKTSAAGMMLPNYKSIQSSLVITV